MTKEEKIKQTYLELIGQEKYNFIKGQINEMGVCQIMDKYHSLITPNTALMDLGFKIDDERITSWLDSAGGYFIPISLKGLEDNNGWIKIESEEDLPEFGYYEVVERNSGIHSRATLDKDFGAKISFQHFSHYQEIKQIPPPLY